MMRENWCRDDAKVPLQDWNVNPEHGAVEVRGVYRGSEASCLCVCAAGV
jgi:hypothetical protein